MEAFGDDYVAHNLPLILLSGLGEQQQAGNHVQASPRSVLSEGGFRVRIDLPPLETELAASILNALSSHDGSDAAWKAQSPSSSQVRLFKFKAVGRVFSLPPRKASPPPHSPRLTAGSGADCTPAPLVLHSPLSPLTPSSPLYPDGILTPWWIYKHQSQLPCTLLVFFPLTADQTTSSLLDNKIKTEISNIRSALSSTSYKTRLVIVLLADGPIGASDIEERLSMIRKGVTLDPKSLFFCPHNVSEAEVDDFTRSLLLSLYPNCIEYYRDLSKHARRKRNRGTTPQPTIAPTNSHVLSSSGWNVRYEFKMGVFAEFRQEMDAACRNYESAYENLFSSEVIESIAVWEARFNEARLLADVIAVRIIRCFLWNAQSTSAVKAWLSHRDRVQDLLDRRAKGTENYAWEAWQCLWSKTMAQLISRSELPVLTSKLPGSSDFVNVFAGPEKSLAVGERLTPWGQLAHEGYWLDMAQTFVQARRERALELTVDDRKPPSQSASRRGTDKANSNNFYLTPAPYEEVPLDGASGFDYTTNIVSQLDAAIQHFENRGQLRMKEILLLKKALEHFHSKAWAKVISILQPMWAHTLWQNAGWWSLLQHVGWTLLECAKHIQDPHLLLALSWELGSSQFDTRPDITYDLSRVLEDCPPSDQRLTIALDSRERATRVAPSFAFVASEGHVGEPIECQCVLSSCSGLGTSPVKLSMVKIVFEGALKPIYINHVPQDDMGPEGETEIISLTLLESSRLSSSVHKRSSAGPIASLLGESNLTIKPKESKIFSFTMIPREAGEVSVASITLILEERDYSLTVTTADFAGAINQWFEIRGGQPFSRRIGPERDVHTLQVLPKPPKVEINARNFKKTYYTNEDIHLDLEIDNNEEEGAFASIQMQLISPIKGAARINWLDGDSPVSSDDEQNTVQALPTRDLGLLDPGTKRTASLLITDTIAALDHELEATITYKLQSDEDLVLQKTLVLDIAVIRPFEANYDFNPRLLSDPWPNFFEMSIDAAKSSSPQGLQHLYQVTANLFSFASEPVVIEAIILTTTKVTGGAIASSTTGVLRDEKAMQKSQPDQISTQINPEQTCNFDFNLSVQKLVLGDRHSVNLGLSLEIGWRRPEANKINTTVLEVPPYQILMAEPRVLITVDKKRSLGSGMEAYSLRYTIENPSMHLLTFNVTMDSSEDFAFAGPKAQAVSLVPISRHAVLYRILPNKSKQWLKVQLNVVDAYFNQTLRVQPAGEGVKADKKGNVLVWVD